MLRELMRRQPKGFMTIPEDKQVTVTTRDLQHRKADSDDVDETFVGASSLEGSKLKLSKIGDVKIKLHRQPQGKIKTCTIIAKNGRYYACLSCEVEEAPLPICNDVVGVDLGIKHLAITSDGEFYDHPKFLRKSERKLRRKQRAVSRKKKGSNRRRKAVRELARLHEHIANQ